MSLLSTWYLVLRLPASRVCDSKLLTQQVGTTTKATKGLKLLICVLRARLER